MTNLLPHLAQQVFNNPFALHPDKAEVIISALSGLMGVAPAGRGQGHQVAQLSFSAEDGFASVGHSRGGYDVVSGVAVIEVHGTLVERLGTRRPHSGMTGYDGILENVRSALTDPEVAAVVLLIDSPGGEVAGCLDVADAIYSGRGTKPIWAILDESAYSAAYVIASAADRIYVPRTGGVGSIGITCAHVDFSKALTSAGLEVTLIPYGGRQPNGNGNSENPLSNDELENLQADIAVTDKRLVDTVARNRRLTTQKIRDMQAGTYLGAEGVKQGLADFVMSPEAAFNKFLEKLA